MCAAFPLGYFPGTTFHGTDKAAMAAASVAAAVAANCAAFSSSEPGEMPLVLRRREKPGGREQVLAKREREQNSLPARSKPRCGSNKNKCPRGSRQPTKYLTQADCKDMCPVHATVCVPRERLCVLVCVCVCERERWRVHSRQCQVDTFTNARGTRQDEQQWRRTVTTIMTMMKMRIPVMNILMMLQVKNLPAFNET